MGQEPSQIRQEIEETRAEMGDTVEIVTLVGGGAPDAPPADKPLVVGKFRFQSRLITGTGRTMLYKPHRYIACRADRMLWLSSFGRVLICLGHICLPRGGKHPWIISLA